MKHGHLFFVLGAACVVAVDVSAMEPGTVPAEYQPHVPQRLLPLVHAPEVQRELALSDQGVAQLEAFFTEIDSTWFGSRNLPADEQLEVVAELETRVHRWFDEHASATQRRRLEQLEIRAQGHRALLRTDVAGVLGLDNQQQQQLAKLAAATDEAKRELAAAQMRGESPDDYQQTVERCHQSERERLTEVVPREQLQKLGQLVGEPFDTQSLRRVYPMAPDFPAGVQWINSEPLQMQQLRGKVVLLHFYAFQCHNCHANFDVYGRWHQELAEQGVVVVGVQTPETTLERDPDAVRAAARDEQLRFPIALDMESKIWQAFGNTMWPTVYVIDQDGYVRMWWAGELRWEGATGDQQVERLVTELLEDAENGD